MAKAVRTLIKEDMNRAIAHQEDVLKYQARIVANYCQKGQSPGYVINAVSFCIDFALEHGIDSPITVYRQLRDKGDMESIGEYDEHLFGIVQLYQFQKLAWDGMNEFKRQERQVLPQW